MFKSSRNLLLTVALIISIWYGISSGILGFTWKDVGERIKFPQLPKVEVKQPITEKQVKITSEESLIIDVVDKVSPSVV
ncbi:MAG: hypothetical protein AAB874_07145, partial [Patescibacteria group bacterium]